MDQRSSEGVLLYIKKSTQIWESTVFQIVFITWLRSFHIKTKTNFISSFIVNQSPSDGFQYLTSYFKNNLNELNLYWIDLE